MQSTNPSSNEDECIDLLQQISTLESKGLEDSVSTRTLRDLKSRYNDLVEASIQRFQCPDLFQYLPTEIWMQILLEVVDDDCLNILPLLQVCQRWISILVSEPRLWKSIYIRRDLDTLELSHSALFLSNDEPLYITVDIPIMSVVQERFLQREASRIRHLKIKAMPGHFQTREFRDQNIHIVEDLLKGLGPLPSLESLTIDIETITKATLSSALRFLNAPNIKYLTPGPSFDDISVFNRFNRLRSMKTSLSLETVIPELAKLTGLKELALLKSGQDARGSPPESYVKSCENITRIESLRLYREPSDYFWSLLSQMNSRIRNLRLKIRWQQVFDFFIIIHGAPYLHELELSIRVDSKDKVNTTHWKAPALPQIQSLRMETFIPISAENNEHNTVSKATRIVLDTLDDSLGGLRKLHIKNSIFGSDLVRFIEGMEHLNTLKLDKSVEHDQVRTISCPSLKFLKANDARVLHYLSMPNLISYTARINDDEADFLTKELPNIDRRFTANVQTLRLDAGLAEMVGVGENEFTQLRRLTWSIHRKSACAEYRFLHRSFPSLTKISFEESCGYKGAAVFSELLLRYPRICPRLRTICIYGYPDWNRFLYMLLRRNVEISRKDISAITSVEVLGYPAPCILVPLSTLLLGKIPLDMLSLEELSYDDMYYNAAIPGCIECIACGLACSTPVTSVVPEKLQDMLEKTIEHTRVNKICGSDPPLPDHTQDWLDSDLERWSGWVEKQKQNGFKGLGQRVRHCERHSQLVVIDGHTLDGVEIDSKELEYPLSQTDHARDW